MLSRRQLVLGALLAAPALTLLGATRNPAPAPQNPCATPAEPMWLAYVNHFVQADGRIVDHNDEAKSTSEGQSYALFHALVANDRERFGQILRWTEDNLAGGDLTQRLPGWKWGLRDDQSWGLLEHNSASDADLWIAYALLEAGRLWQNNAYSQLGQSVLNRIRSEESEEIPGLGPMLLPGREGFKLGRCQWRLNPSYLPIQLLRALAHHQSDGDWNAMASATAKLIHGSSPKGMTPDWVIYDPTQGFINDPLHGERSSYDAIRVYLWLGMLDSAEPLRADLLQQLSFDCIGECWPPEFSLSRSGERYGEGPIGFKAAVLPWLKAKGNDACLQRLQQQIATAPKAAIANYYDENLKLFALGWVNHHYRFDKDGLLQPQWIKTCP